MMQAPAQREYIRNMLRELGLRRSGVTRSVIPGSRRAEPESEIPGSRFARPGMTVGIN